MSNFMNFFFSFDKLMKEKLVIAFFWLSLIAITIEFVGDALDNVGLGLLDEVTDFVGFFVAFLLWVIGIRLLCEIGIAIFRINDNLSPDGGKSETADIDPIEEALKAARAAEDAAKKATASARSAIVRTKSDDTSPAPKKDTKPAPKSAPAKASPAKTSPAKKTTAKKPATKKPAAKKTTAKTPTTRKPKAKPSTAKKGPTLNKDGTPRKKRGPKPKS